MRKILQNPLELSHTLSNNLLALEDLASDMAIIPSIEDDTTRDRVLEDLAHLRCALE